MTELLQREELLEQLDGARVAGGRLVFVGGEAGVGKTSLVRAFAARAGGRLLSGSCESLATPTPLGPFLDLGIEPAEPRLVAGAVLEELRRPALLLLEDLHWADGATLDVLRVLGRRIDATPSLAVATYRDDEVEREHPLRVVLGDLALGRGGLAARRPAPVGRGRAGARRAVRRRRGRDPRGDAGQRVLRHGGARGRRRRAARDGPRRRARARGPARSRAAASPRRGFARAGARRALAARGHHRRRRRRARGLPRLGDAGGRRRRRRLPARARTPGRGGRRCAPAPSPASRRDPRGACILRRTRPLPPRPPRRGGGRPGGGARARPGRRPPCDRGGRASRGRGAVRPCAAARRRHAPA